MKNKLFIHVAALLTMLMLLTACGKNEAPTGDFSQADLGVLVNGETYLLRESAAELLAELGEPTKTSEQVSCVYDGKDKRFTYQGIEISTVPVGGEDVIEMITLTDTTYKTLRNVGVGSTLEEVVAAYGEKYFDDGYITYSLTGDATDIQAERIQFEFALDEVVCVYIYSPSY